jgi:predicted HicB family RNase H-like nuclease
MGAGMETEGRTHDLNIRITPSIHTELKSLARKQGRSIGEMVREGIIYILTKYELAHRDDKLRP